MDTDKTLLHEIVDAWESLKGGRQVNTRDIEKWLSSPMSPTINKIREHLGRELPK